MMHCSPNCRDHTVLQCSWNARDLRANLGGGQGKIYLRPIQKSLSTQPLLHQSQSEVKERCHMCNKDILVRKLRDHLWSCTEGLDSDDDTVDQNPDAIVPTLSGNSNTETTVSSSLSQSPSVGSLSTLATSATPIVSHSVSSSFAATPTLRIGPAMEGFSISDLTGSPAEANINNNQPSFTNSEQSIDEIVCDTISYCQEHDAVNPVEILRCFQQKMVTGRALEIQRVDEVSGGETNFIMVDRHNLIETAFDEIMFHHDYRKTLQVQFYGEVSSSTVHVCYKM